MLMVFDREDFHAANIRNRACGGIHKRHWVLRREVDAPFEDGGPGRASGGPGQLS